MVTVNDHVVHFFDTSNVNDSLIVLVDMPTAYEVVIFFSRLAVLVSPDFA